MPSIFKPGSLQRSEDVVLIPDIPQPKPEVEEVEPVILPTQEECDAIIESAREEGRQAAQSLISEALAKREEMLAEARVEAERLKSEAEDAGYQEGVSLRQREIEETIGEVWRVLDDLRDIEEEYLRRYGQELKFLAVDIAAKVLNRRITQEELELTSLVEHALSTVKNADWITVEVSDQLPGLVRHLSEQLPKREVGAKSLQVEGKDLPIDACFIQTAEGVVDASVSTQLENLREMMRTSTS